MPRSYVTVAVGTFIELIFLAVVARRMWRSDAASWFCAAAARWPITAFRGCRRKEEMSDEDRRMEEQVRSRLDERRVAYTRGGSMVLAVGCAVRLPIWAAGIIWGASDDVNDPFTWALLLCFSLSVLAIACPALVNPRTVSLWHLVYMFATSLVIVPSADTAVERGMLLLRPSLNAATVGFSLLCIKFRVLAFSNACFSAVIIWFYEESPKDIGSVDTLSLLYTELFDYLFKIMCYWVFESVLTSNVRQEIQGQVGQCQRSAVTALLRMMCDAVVDADSEYRLKAHEDSLSSLLMLGPGRALKGELLTSFVSNCDDDRDKFESSLRNNTSETEESPCANMFGARFRDSMGQMVKVLVYHVPYTTIYGSVHHLIGLRDDSEYKEGGSSNLCASVPSTEATLRPEINDRIGSLGVVRTGTASSSGSSASSVPGQHTMTADVAVADRLPITGCTANFRSSLGVSEEHRSMFDICPLDGDALLAWVQSRAAAVRTGASDAPRVEEFGDVRIRSGAGGWTRRRLRVCFPPPPADETALYEVSIKMARSRGGGPGGPMGTPPASSSAAQALPHEGASALRPRLHL